MDDGVQRKSTRLHNFDYGTTGAYFDHIIRDKKDYEVRKKYIYENPVKWYYEKVYEDE